MIAIPVNHPRPAYLDDLTDEEIAERLAEKLGRADDLALEHVRLTSDIAELDRELRRRRNAS